MTSVPIRARLYSPVGGISDTLQDYFAKVGNVDFVVNEGKRTDFYGHSCFASNPRVGNADLRLLRPIPAPCHPILQRLPSVADRSLPSVTSKDRTWDQGTVTMIGP